MSDSDDELPPPLEDMTEKVDKMVQRKQNYLQGINKSEEIKNLSNTSSSQATK